MKGIRLGRMKEIAAGMNERKEVERKNVIEKVNK
jgi:hypothetical protein